MLPCRSPRIEFNCAWRCQEPHWPLKVAHEPVDWPRISKHGEKQPKHGKTHVKATCKPRIDFVRRVAASNVGHGHRVDRGQTFSRWFTHGLTFSLHLPGLAYHHLDCVRGCAVATIRTLKHCVSEALGKRTGASPASTKQEFCGSWKRLAWAMLFVVQLFRALCPPVFSRGVDGLRSASPSPELCVFECR